MGTRYYNRSYHRSYRRSIGNERARQHINAANALYGKYGPAFDQIKAVFFSLDNNRINSLLIAYGKRHGVAAQNYACETYSSWKSGRVTMAGQTVTRLFDLLPRFMTHEEKLDLIKSLREQTLKRLRKANVSLTIGHASDLTTVLNQVMGLVRRVGEIELPQDFYEIQGWIAEADAQALNSLARDMEQYIAVQRLTDLMVQLANISLLRQVAELGLSVKVHTHFEVPTATVDIRFTKSYWKETSEQMSADDDLLYKLQEMALREAQQDGAMTYVDYVMRTLTLEEQAKLRAIAAAEGLKTEILLKELQVKTLASRGDIQSVMDTAAELKRQGHKSRISSEHQTASGVTRIEIDNKKSGCVGSLVLMLIGASIAIAGAATYFHSEPRTVQPPAAVIQSQSPATAPSLPPAPPISAQQSQAPITPPTATVSVPEDQVNGSVSDQPVAPTVTTPVPAQPSADTPPPSTVLDNSDTTQSGSRTTSSSSTLETLDEEGRKQTADRLAELGVQVDWREHSALELLDWEGRVQTANRLAALGVSVNWRDHQALEMLDWEGRIQTANRLRAKGISVDWHKYSSMELLDMGMHNQARG